ncbi:MAG: DUF1549 and DUF1553 domain-containing protein [Planctomycetota bacterium]
MPIAPPKTRSFSKLDRVSKSLLFMVTAACLTCFIILQNEQQHQQAMTEFLAEKRLAAKIAESQTGNSEQLDQLDLELDEAEDESEKLYEFPPFDEHWWKCLLHNEAIKIARKPRQKPIANSPNHLVSAVLSKSEAVSKSQANIHPGKRFDFWSFGEFRKVEPPAVQNEKWIKNPIDRFVLARLEAKNFKPADEASKEILARRIWFDLTGLPPQLEELKNYSQNSSDSAYEQLVDTLLTEQTFGERWASFWLDLARYSDSNGYEEDEIKPYAFPYRDFVIWAMNVDLPFDQFIQWQIAGDLIEPSNPLAVAATGFFTNAPLNTFMPQESERFDELADQVATMGRAMMGLSIGCARCHDHFYDPISHKEYHQLVAIFKDTRRERRYLVPDQGKEFLLVGGPIQKREAEITKLLLAAQKEQNISQLDDADFSEEDKELLRQPIDPNNKRQALLASNCKRCLNVEERFIGEDDEPLEQDRVRYDQLVEEIDRLSEFLLPMPPVGLTLAGDSISKMPILEGGNAKRKGELVGPGFLSALTTGMPEFERSMWERWNQTDDGTLSPRRALANWMTDLETGAGPLVARVIVNRVWQQHFGRGLVNTPSDFGSEGEAPSHPALLEWLAGQLIDHDWRLKPIHRLIVTSATYRQRSRTELQILKQDPENIWLSRQNLIRMNAEMIRDAMLVASDEINLEMYGQPSVPTIPVEAIFHTQNSPEYTWPNNEDDDTKRNRRSVYLFVKRTIPMPLLNLFDAPDGGFSCDQRSKTTLPTQALALMNAPFVEEQSRLIAERFLNTETGLKRREIINLVYQAILNRDAKRTEIDEAVRFLAPFNGGPLDEDRLTQFCHVLLMTNEFIYLQ